MFRQSATTRVARTDDVIVPDVDESVNGVGATLVVALNNIATNDIAPNVDAI